MEINTNLIRLTSPRAVELFRPEASNAIQPAKTDEIAVRLRAIAQQNAAASQISGLDANKVAEATASLITKSPAQASMAHSELNPQDVFKLLH